MGEALTSHDHRRRRCGMLGHEVPFAYCRNPGRDIPCRKILDCWWQTFDVVGFLREHHTEDQIRQILTPSQDKRVSLVELIQRAQKKQ